jgi:hypothetical protein
MDRRRRGRTSRSIRRLTPRRAIPMNRSPFGSHIGMLTIHLPTSRLLTMKARDPTIAARGGGRWRAKVAVPTAKSP